MAGGSCSFGFSQYILDGSEAERVIRSVQTRFCSHGRNAESVVGLYNILEQTHIV